MVLVGALVAGCGPGVSERQEPDSDFAERCESFDPTQLLELEPDEIVPFSPDVIVPYEGSWLVGVATLEAPFEGTLGEQYSAMEHRVVSIDDCGRRPPRLFAEGLRKVMPPRHPDLPWLGCGMGDEVFVIDPRGEQPPVLVGPVAGCRRHESADAIWMRRRIDRWTDELIRLSSRAEVEVVVPALLIGTKIALGEHYLWVIDNSGDLVEYELETGAMVTLAENVSLVEVSATDRFIAWGTNLEFGIGEGPWTILDRDTGELHAVEFAGTDQVNPRLAGFSFVFDDLDFEHSGPDPDPSEVTTAVIQLPSLETSTYPGLWGQHQEVGPGDLVVTARGEEVPSVHVLRAGDSTPQLLFEGEAYSIDVDDGDVWVWDFYDWDEPLINTERVETARLLRFAPDDPVPEVVIDGVFVPLGIDDGRWLSVRDYAGDGHGELRLFDPAAGTEQVVDRDVALFFAQQASLAKHARASTILPSDAPFHYTVQDDGARNGLWRMQLPPR